MSKQLRSSQGKHMDTRLLNTGDYKDVYNLWQTERIGLNNVDDTQAGFERFLARNPRTCFAAIKDGTIIGTILCGDDGRIGHIYHACIAREHQNKQVGTQLVKMGLAALKEEGVSHVSLSVYADNEPGNRFWERLGFNELDFLRHRHKALVEIEWFNED